MSNELNLAEKAMTRWKNMSKELKQMKKINKLDSYLTEEKEISLAELYYLLLDLYEEEQDLYTEFLLDVLDYCKLDTVKQVFTDYVEKTFTDEKVKTEVKTKINKVKEED